MTIPPTFIPSRVWKYFLTYLLKATAFVIVIVFTMYVFNYLMIYMGVPKEDQLPLWMMIYGGAGSIFFMWDAAKSRVERENREILKAIDRGQ